MTDPALRPEMPAVPAVPAAASAEVPSPGRLLRLARERAGLGAEDLAGQLKLAKGTLDALERDDFDSLSEPVYIRGYYRKIAKLLPVSDKELIDAYNARTRPEPAAASAAMRRIPLAGGVAAGTSRQYRGQGIWIIAAGVIIAGLVFALAQRESPKRLAIEEPKGEPAAVSVPPATLTPSSTLTSPDPAAAAPAPAPAAPSQVAPAKTAPGATPAPTPAASTPAATSTATPAPAPAPAAPPAAPNQLVLEFSESSFVRVEDGRGKTLAIGLVRGGERQELKGEPPYTVFLGNAQNVKVFLGGTPVDFSQHINRQNDTARFTVP